MACDMALRRRMTSARESLGLPVLSPSPVLCTDIGAMIAAAATFRYQVCRRDYQYPTFLDLDAGLDLDISEMAPVSA